MVAKPQPARVPIVPYKIITGLFFCILGGIYAAYRLSTGLDLLLSGIIKKSLTLAVF